MFFILKNGLHHLHRFYLWSKSLSMSLTDLGVFIFGLRFAVCVNQITTLSVRIGNRSLKFILHVS